MKLILATLVAILMATAVALAEEPTGVSEKTEIDKSIAYMDMDQFSEEHYPVPGETRGLWHLRISVYDGESSSPFSENIMYLNPHMPATATAGNPGWQFSPMITDPVDRLGTVIWMVPAGLDADFQEHGHLDLPELIIGDAPAAMPTQKRELFEQLLGRSQHIQVANLHLYLFSPYRGRAEISLGWEDKDRTQATRPPEFYRTAEQREAEEAAGLKHERGAIPVADITVYFSNGGEWAGGDH
ncbi:MAG: hypothetical protein H7A35_03560 [Planctomycetales bacterium]|nr:hypothetical protein [bacterium]UNM09132.1 MAG: hypothetical protein H7A35_03560 [Planctomycetales bacterium]